MVEWLKMLQTIDRAYQQKDYRTVVVEIKSYIEAYVKESIPEKIANFEGKGKRKITFDRIIDFWCDFVAERSHQEDLLHLFIEEDHPNPEERTDELVEKTKKEINKIMARYKDDLEKLRIDVNKIRNRVEHEGYFPDMKEADKALRFLDLFTSPPITALGGFYDYPSARDLYLYLTGRIDEIMEAVEKKFSPDSKNEVRLLLDALLPIRPVDLVLYKELPFQSDLWRDATSVPLIVEFWIPLLGNFSDKTNVEPEVDFDEMSKCARIGVLDTIAGESSESITELFPSIKVDFTWRSEERSGNRKYLVLSVGIRRKGELVKKGEEGPDFKWFIAGYLGLPQF